MTARIAAARPSLLAALAVGIALPLGAQDTLEGAAPDGASDYVIPRRATDTAPEPTLGAASETASEAAPDAAPETAFEPVSDAVSGADPETTFGRTPDAAAANPAAEPATKPADTPLAESVLATVNERPIPALSLENIARQLGAEGEEPDRGRILDELIDLEILTQEAEKMALDRRPEIAAALQLQYTQTMANAYLAAIGEEIEFTEEELRAEYERQTANIEREEYRASHILLESEAEAKAVIDELADGADFETLARERSIDPAGRNGGDIGWFMAGSMVPEFTAAVEPMEVGETSETPVKSDFGYHVILLSDKRGAALPDYESVKPGLTNLALRNRLAARVEALREAADVVRR